MSGYGHGSGGGWPGLRQVLLVRTTRVPLKKGAAGGIIVEDHYYLTSLPVKAASGEQLLALVRSHWLIENELHHVKDRTLGEDAQRHKKGALGACRLRSLVPGLLRGVAGKSTPHKIARLAAKPRLALKLLSRKRNTSILL